MAAPLLLGPKQSSLGHGNGSSCFTPKEFQVVLWVVLNERPEALVMLDLHTCTLPSGVGLQPLCFTALPVPWPSNIGLPAITRRTTSSLGPLVVGPSSVFFVVGHVHVHPPFGKDPASLRSEGPVETPRSLRVLSRSGLVAMPSSFAPLGSRTLLRW